MGTQLDTSPVVWVGVIGEFADASTYRVLQKKQAGMLDLQTAREW